MAKKEVSKKPRKRPASVKHKVQRASTDLTDPKQTDRIRSADYVEIYTNHIEILISQQDIKLRLMTLSGNEPMHGGKAVIEEKAAIILSHNHALTFSNLLADLLERNFEQFDVKKPEIPKGN